MKWINYILIWSGLHVLPQRQMSYSGLHRSPAKWSSSIQPAHYDMGHDLWKIWSSANQANICWFYLSSKPRISVLVCGILKSLTLDPLPVLYKLSILHSFACARALSICICFLRFVFRYNGACTLCSKMVWTERLIRWILQATMNSRLNQWRSLHRCYWGGWITCTNMIHSKTYGWCLMNIQGFKAQSKSFSFLAVK